VGEDEAISGEVCSTPAVVRDVVYLGMHTRYRVELPGGERLLVAEQNRAGTAADVHEARSRRVRLVWDRAANRPVGAGR
jgi:ABC-type Fe3+/spermidine/putrescine transport system ATPase subunit